MGIITIVDIEKIVEDFGETLCGTNWYFIIRKEFVDGIKKWLDSYIYSIEGEWLDYSLQESVNETELYILHLYSRW